MLLLLEKITKILVNNTQSVEEGQTLAIIG